MPALELAGLGSKPDVLGSPQYPPQPSQFTVERPSSRWNSQPKKTGQLPPYPEPPQSSQFQDELAPIKMPKRTDCKSHRESGSRSGSGSNGPGGMRSVASRTHSNRAWRPIPPTPPPATERATAARPCTCGQNSSTLFASFKVETVAPLMLDCSLDTRYKISGRAWRAIQLKLPTTLLNCFSSPFVTRSAGFLCLAISMYVVFLVLSLVHSRVYASRGHS